MTVSSSVFLQFGTEQLASTFHSKTYSYSPPPSAVWFSGNTTEVFANFTVLQKIGNSILLYINAELKGEPLRFLKGSKYDCNCYAHLQIIKATFNCAVSQPGSA